MNNPSIANHAHISDYLNTTAIFGEVRKTIISKDFQGGKINSLFGETVLDFSDVDISGVVILDISQAFGEINLAVPANWHVETDVSQFLSVTRDRRAAITESKNGEKILLITGHSVFAAINIIDSKV